MDPRVARQQAGAAEAALAVDVDRLVLRADGERRRVVADEDGLLPVHDLLRERPGPIVAATDERLGSTHAGGQARAAGAQLRDEHELGVEALGGLAGREL